ncbi:keratin-associated protein 13-1 [Cricetulus griseus]|uniref:keratin-associated protein 13-1 n=1 Tax=Cricetulus griseus TaxID=10029 RepID=UPI000F73C598|nr:keratin-associated protein 13-1 [Cricetulus griseus]
MAYSCCSANFSSGSRRYCLPSSGSSCGSSYPSNLVYTTTSCSPSTCQLGSSLSSGCQEIYIESTSCQRSCVVSSPCQTACYYPRSFTPCSPSAALQPSSLPQELPALLWLIQWLLLVLQPGRHHHQLLLQHQHCGSQETGIKPTRFQRSCMMSNPCQMTCYYSRSSTLCRPHQGTYISSLSFWPGSDYSLGNGSRGCFSWTSDTRHRTFYLVTYGFRDERDTLCNTTESFYITV